MGTRWTSFKRLSGPFVTSPMPGLRNDTQLKFYKTHTCSSHSIFSVEMVPCIRAPPSLRLSSSNLVHTNLQLRRWHTIMAHEPPSPCCCHDNPARGKLFYSMQHHPPPWRLFINTLLLSCVEAMGSSPGFLKTSGYCPWTSSLFVPLVWQKNEPLSEAVHERGKH